MNASTKTNGVILFATILFANVSIITSAKTNGVILFATILFANAAINTSDKANEVILFAPHSICECFNKHIY